MKTITKLTLATAILTITTAAQAFVVPFEVSKNGEFTVGYDSSSNSKIKKEINVEFNTKDNSKARIMIDGVDLNQADREGSKISAYAKNPVRYNYYVVDLAPLKQDDRIMAGKSGASTTFCPADSNSLVKAYKGDGSMEVFCATIK